MSLFEEDFFSTGSTKTDYCNNNNYWSEFNQQFQDISDVITADYSAVEVPEMSLNLEEMISGVSEFMSEYQDDTVKRENLDERCLPASLEYSTLSAASSPYSVVECGSSSPSSKRRALDKNSDEYKRRRRLNNIAVKKSREKAKAESRLVSQRLTVLTADNERLERRVELLTQEINFLQGLFSRVDGVPQHIQSQVAKVVQRLSR